jgi:hypothetical protein
MTLKRKLFVTYLHFLESFFLRKRFNATVHINCDITPLPSATSLDIVSIAFNNEFLVEQQIRLIKKHLQDKNYTHIIADNSTDKEKRKRIQGICARYHIAYISLPFNPVYKFLKKASYAHGMAMNWVYYNFIQYRRPAIFGFIDHDLFPIENYSVREQFEKYPNQDFFGVLRDRTQGWYLWAGLCFYKFDKIKSYKINFNPYVYRGIYLDTGGTNYVRMYSKYNKDGLKFCKPATAITINADGTNYHNDIIHRIDEAWIHAINGSNWAKLDDKTDFLREFLSHY